MEEREKRGKGVNLSYQHSLKRKKIQIIQHKFMFMLKKRGEKKKFIMKDFKHPLPKRK